MDGGERAPTAAGPSSSSREDRAATSLPIDARLNFPRGLLSDEQVASIRDAILEGDAGLVAALASGLPMAPYALDSLLAVRVRHRHAKVRLALEPLIGLAVRAAHLANSREICRESAERHDLLFAEGEDLSRLDAGLRRLYRGAGLDRENAHDLLSLLRDRDLSRGAYRQAVRHLYSVMERLGAPVEEASARLDYSPLGVFHYLFESPKFTTEEAVRTYAANLAALTKREPTPLRLLSAVRRSKEPPEVVNDLLFGLALGYAIVAHQNALLALRKHLLMLVNRACDRLYLAYTQAPETRDAFAATAREGHALITSTSDEPPDFGPFLTAAFRFVEGLAAADVFVNPEYVEHGIFAVRSRFHGLEAAIVGHDDDLETETDPGSPYEISYHVTNPYTDPRVFRCPRDLLAHLGPATLRKRLTVDFFRELTVDDDLTMESYDLGDPQPLMLEGAARCTRASVEQLEAYLGTVDTQPLDLPAEIMSEEEAGDRHADLFADVEPRRRPASERRRRAGGGGGAGRDLVDVSGARPPGTPRPSRRRRREDSDG